MSDSRNMQNEFYLTPVLDDKDCSMYLFQGLFINPDRHFKELREEINFEESFIKIAGRECKLGRLIAYFGDKGSQLKYNGIVGEPNPWGKAIAEVKAIVEDFFGETYNFCICGLYRDGGDSISYHSDKLQSLVPGYPIVSVTFGATRDFMVKPRKDALRRGLVEDIKPIRIPLNNGDVCTMSLDMQNKYLHSVPRRANVTPIDIEGYGSTTERINITFRRTINVLDD